RSSDGGPRRDHPGRPDRVRLLQLAASAEQYSSHTLAASIVAAARTEGIALCGATDAVESESDGVAARVDGHEVAVGTLAFARRRAPESEPLVVAGGRVVSYVLVDGRPSGALVLGDPVRPEARATVEAIRAQGIADVVMLTGDAQSTAEAAAAEVGVAVLRAECRPGDKVSAVRALTRRPVLMIGDGVNDAPVLAVADVGVAMGARGASAASDTADAVVLVESVERVAVALRIGRDTVRIAQQSIWIGMGASVGLMLVASTGVVPAVLGALLQEVVDVVTIVASLRATAGPTSAAGGGAPVRIAVPER
ncbi:HAD-IC family P-type ATPase, partial [Curtobacterium sp. B18]|uniref:HAD-IC family P-type ATPase n=1 Tax=Curtobacterium sp. B18 TaxID=95614 RepID=UPI0005B2CC24